MALAVQAVLEGHASTSGLSTIDAEVLQARRRNVDFALRQSSETVAQMYVTVDRVSAALAQLNWQAVPVLNRRLERHAAGIDGYRRSRTVC